MKDKIYKLLPDFLQGILIGIFNFLAYRKRYGKEYWKYLLLFQNNKNISLGELKIIQKKRFRDLITYAKKNSKYYKDYPLVDIECINELPIISKESLRENIYDVYTLPKNEGIISKTGGTTGKSLEVVFTKDNIQERFAMLDCFRGNYGYKLGKKTAWFSGKSLLNNKDINLKRFWKTDPFHNVRYYSTFHIKEENLKYYLDNLIMYKPEFLVGFPSTMLEIAKYGLKIGYKYPMGSINAIFPTAETITPVMRETIESFFNARIFNQYASSEGAPFIFECDNGNLHLELQSGVFEVIDYDGNLSNEGQLVVTSFTTFGTPLIRYNIGDFVVLENELINCGCGNNNTLVKEILGRVDDYVYSIENGKINLGNVSNTLKDTKGIIQFQVVQNELNKIEILLVRDINVYNEIIERKFINNWIQRVGNKTELMIKYVDHIKVEKSGKFRLVKNNIKHLL